eukprot:6617660-Alexandrium_andersonii.AAC.1
MYQRSAQQCFEDAARCFREAGLAALRRETAEVPHTTVQIVEEIAAARPEGGSLPALAVEEEEEEPGYQAEAEEQPGEVQPRAPSKRRRLERPRAPPRDQPKPFEVARSRTQKEAQAGRRLEYEED